MYENLLKSAGLTENESKVYLSLLKLGLSTTSIIVQEAAISSGKIYETLDKLHKKGLVSITEIRGVKHFQTTSPQALLTYIDEQKKSLEEKKKELENILPGLLSLQAQPKYPTSVNMIIGERSIRPLIDELFTKAKQTICAMGIRGSKNRRYNDFWWHTGRAIIKKKKTKAYYLFSENKSEYFKKHLKLGYIEVRSMQSVTPIAIDIVDNDVLIFSYGDEFTCVHISNKDIADSFRGFFMSLWNQAKKP